MYHNVRTGTDHLTVVLLMKMASRQCEELFAAHWPVTYAGQERRIFMTADRLQLLVTLLSRGAWVRHWLHWNYPSESPWLMAIDIRDSGNRPIDMNGEMEKSGFTRLANWEPITTGECTIWTIPRTNRDGTPYVSGSKVRT